MSLVPNRSSSLYRRTVVNGSEPGRLGPTGELVVASGEPRPTESYAGVDAANTGA